MSLALEITIIIVIAVICIGGGIWGGLKSGDGPP